MALPILYQIYPFDATEGCKVEFTYDGDQVVGNELEITNNETGVVAYRVKYDNIMTTSHIISGQNNGLVNGGYYSARIRVYNRNGVASSYSNPRTFHCFIKPDFLFTNVANNQIIQNSQYTFRLRYDDKGQDEPLNTYYFVLYNSAMNEIARTEVRASSVPLEYAVQGLSDSTMYYVRAFGTSLNNINLDTGAVPFSISFVRPNYWSFVDLQNNKNDGSIKISSNIVSLEGEVAKSPEFVNGTEVDLSDNSLLYGKNFMISDDFILQMKVRNPKCNKDIMRLESNTGYINLRYEAPYLDARKIAEPTGDGHCGQFVMEANEYGLTETFISDKYSVVSRNWETASNNGAAISTLTKRANRKPLMKVYGETIVKGSGEPSYTNIRPITGLDCYDLIIVFKGTETFAMDSALTPNTRKRLIYTNSIIPPNNYTGGLEDMICTHFPTMVTKAGYDRDTDCVARSESNNKIVFTYKDFTTIEQWKQYFAEQYAAGTPVCCAIRTNNFAKSGKYYTAIRTTNEFGKHRAYIFGPTNQPLCDGDQATIYDDGSVDVEYKTKWRIMTGNENGSMTTGGSGKFYSLYDGDVKYIKWDDSTNSVFPYYCSHFPTVSPGNIWSKNEISYTMLAPGENRHLEPGKNSQSGPN